MNNIITLRQEVIKVLKTVFDPELPVNIWELGLIYGFDLTKNESQNYNCNILMTLTSPNCPSVQTITNSIKNSLQSTLSIENVNIEITFDPIWDKSILSDELLLELDLL